MAQRLNSLGNFLFRHRSFVPLPLIAATFLFFHPAYPGKTGFFLAVTGLTVSLSGALLRIRSVGTSASGTSGRETFLRAEHLNSTGPYSVVRNPLYWGNILIFTGLFTVYGNPVALALAALFLTLEYHLIIRVEEDYLKNQYGSLYLNYCQKTNRWLPSWKSRTPPANPFNRRKVMFEENDSLFNLLVSFLIILGYREWHFSGRIPHLPVYTAATAVILALYIWIKIKKRESSRSMDSSNLRGKG